MLARCLGVPLVRLQCYEGLSAAEALYDWNYQRQLLAIRLAESHGERLTEADLFSEEYLIERPVLRCVRYDGPHPPVLLVDEIDRADDEFEALLLEVLGEGSVTVPEIGTFTASPPADRRTHLEPQPRPARRAATALPLPLAGVPRARAGVRDPAPHRPRGQRGPDRLRGAVRRRVRALEVDKPPGMAEAINWVAALSALGATELVRDTVVATLGAVVKTVDDRDAVVDGLDAVLDG